VTKGENLDYRDGWKIHRVPDPLHNASRCMEADREPTLNACGTPMAIKVSTSETVRNLHTEGPRISSRADNISQCIVLDQAR